MEMSSPAYKGIKRFQDGDNAALRKVILQVTPKAVEQMCPYAKQFQGKTELETAQNIWNFLKNNIRYVADGEYQIVRLPSALMSTKEGDCKSYSVFTSAILQCLGIPHYYAMTSYNPKNPTPSHIYVVTDSGIIIDAVWHSFNSQKDYSYIYKIKPYSTMKSNTGLGATAVPTFKVGMGSVPTFRVGMGAVPSGNVLMGNCPCGCGGKCGKGIGKCSKGMGSCGCSKGMGSCGCSKGMGAISKTQVNAPLRELILLFFKSNVGGLATKFQSAGIGDDKLGKWFTSMGGNGQELWAAIKEGSSKPVVAKWFGNSIKNLTIRELRRKQGIAGIGATDTNPQTETTEESNNTDYQQYQDIIAQVSAADSQSKIKVLFTALGGLVVQILPPCAADPTGVIKSACAVGGGVVGYALAAVYNEIVRALFPKPEAPLKLEWSSVKKQIDSLASYLGQPIDAMTQTICRNSPNSAVINSFPCSLLVGKTTYSQDVIDTAIAVTYFACGKTSRELQTMLIGYLSQIQMGQSTIDLYNKGVYEAGQPLPEVSETGAAMSTASGGLVMVAAAVAVLIAFSGKKVKGTGR